jgi:hypothetical protein
VDLWVWVVLSYLSLLFVAASWTVVERSRSAIRERGAARRQPTRNAGH